MNPSPSIFKASAEGRLSRRRAGERKSAAGDGQSSKSDQRADATRPKPTEQKRAATKERSGKRGAKSASAMVASTVAPPLVSGLSGTGGGAPLMEGTRTDFAAGAGQAIEGAASSLFDAASAFFRAPGSTDAGNSHGVRQFSAGASSTIREDNETSESSASPNHVPVARTGNDYPQLLNLVAKYKNQINADFANRLNNLAELGYKTHWRDMGDGVLFNQHIHKLKGNNEIWYGILAQRNGLDASADTPHVTAVIQQARRGLSRAPASLENQPFIGNILFPHKTFFGPNDEGTYETWVASPGTVSLANEPETSRHIHYGVSHAFLSHLPESQLEPKYLDLSAQLSNLSSAEKDLFFFKALSLEHDLTDELREILEEGGWSFSPKSGRGPISGNVKSPQTDGAQRTQSANWVKSGNDLKLIQFNSNFQSEGYSSRAKLLKGIKQRLAQLELREQFSGALA